jgi:hypothetical protein
VIKADKDINKGYGRKMGKVGTKIPILLVFVVCILLIATMPVSAMVDYGTDASTSTDQTATCPCKSQSSTPQTTTTVPSAATDASILNQLAESSYSPSNTAQQAVTSAPQYSSTVAPANAANVNTITPTSVQNNAGTTETTGTAPTADFSNLFSRWINNEIGGSVPGYSLRNPTDQMFGINPMYTTNSQMVGSYPVYTANDQTVGVNPIYTGWQTSPINTVQTPVQANWLYGLM